jgi:lysozyme family protein
MAQASKLMPHILQWEGGFVNDPDDAGGATNMGVTIATWKRVGWDKDMDGDIDEQDLRLLVASDALHVFRIHYWDKCRASDILSQSVANAIVDWAYNSGPATAAKKVQEIVGVTVDGVIGPKTLTAINAAYPAQLFRKIQASRTAFVEAIVRNKPSQAKFLRGWKNRIASLKFTT